MQINRSTFVALCILLTTSVSAQLYTFRNFNHRDGLFMATINCLNQTPDGYLWIGTDGGELIRFDGERFVESRDENGDNNHHFTSIEYYGDSVLFSSRYKGYFAYLRRDKRITKIAPNYSFAGNPIGFFRFDKTYYHVTDKGIYVTKPKKNSTQLYSAGQGELKISQSIKLENGILLLTNHGGFLLAQGKLTKLRDWLGMKLNDEGDFLFGNYENGKLSLYNNTCDRWLEIVMNSRGGFFSIREYDQPFALEENEVIVSASFNEKAMITGVLTNLNQIYTLKQNELNLVAHNYDRELEAVTGILTDMNGDFWINSSLRGIYKVSIEAFTKLQLLPLYQKPDIMFPFRTIYGDVIISTLNGKTYMRNLVDEHINFTFDFTIHGAAEINGNYYFASNTGIKCYHPDHAADFPTVFFDNQKVNMVFADGQDLWAGVAGKGLFRINTKTGSITAFNEQFNFLPEYFYTAQLGSRGNLLFGSNDGIYLYSKSGKHLKKIEFPYKRTGSYSGVSSKDIYGTCWFTLEKGIVGISNSNEVFYIEGDKNFKTNVFYTLNSDNYGNLIVGTNKGITILKIDRNGEVSDKRHYDGDSGFEGYETHMRSQYQNEDGIFVGTVEGLYLINTKILENLRRPLAPVIEDLSVVNSADLTRRNFHFRFQVNNPKAGKLSYSYRVIGLKDTWTTAEGNTIQLFDLDNGKYTLEVRSSFDGVQFSESAFYPIEVRLPIWQSKWFISVLILLIVALNITLLRYNKAFEMNKLLDTKDSVVHLRMTPEILLYAALIVTGAHIISPLINQDLELHLGITLLLGFSLLTLFFISLHARQQRAEHLYQNYLIIGLTLVLGHFFYELYLSDLHPFHTIGIIITCMIVPYILNKIRATVIYSLIILAVAIIISLFVKEPVYPKPYLIVAVFSAISLLIFTSYLRYDSVEKLMFISGIINKGNVPAIAFDRKGSITYVSENISNFIPQTHDELIGKPISSLNRFVPFNDVYRNVDILTDFVDGQKYTVPMQGTNSIIRWVEWSYKDFSKNVKVILGLDISEKIELENTYELLVQHAEDLIYRCDINGNFLFLNEVSYRKLGYDKKELIGRHATSIVREDYKEEVLQYLNEHFSERKTASYKEFPVVTKTGDVIWLGQQITTLLAPGSDYYVNGYIALARDITREREQLQLIREQRDNITDSINYAKRIQFNLLPHERLFASCFKEHFIIFKPKDIVSGDFYWKAKVGNQCILALADCTGHGVPGSFMTLLGINLLNTIILEEEITDPGRILSELDKRLVDVLPRGEGANQLNDGMEITVCSFDENSYEMSFACAGSRFLIYSKNEFTMLKGDIKHIGDKTVDGFVAYQTHFTRLDSEDQLYLFTDGFQDQFGGPNDKKFSFRRVLEMFESTNELPLFEQKEIISKEFDEWIGNGEQTDDLTLISVVRHVV